MQFVGVTNDGPRLGDDLGDRGGIENAHAARYVGAQGAAQRHGPGAALFERRVVEIRVRIRVENLVTERRRLGRIDGDRFDLAALERPENRHEAVDVHCLVQTVVDRLADEHVIGDADRAGKILLTRDLIGKYRGEQIFGTHPQELRRNLAATRKTQDRKRPHRVPTPARGEHRRGQQRLRQHVLGARGF